VWKGEALSLKAIACQPMVPKFKLAMQVSFQEPTHDKNMCRFSHVSGWESWGSAFHPYDSDGDFREFRFVPWFRVDTPEQLMSYSGLIFWAGGVKVRMRVHILYSAGYVVHTLGSAGHCHKINPCKGSCSHFGPLGTRLARNLLRVGEGVSPPSLRGGWGWGAPPHRAGVGGMWRRS
jgi:hypothetical protein